MLCGLNGRVVEPGHARGMPLHAGRDSGITNKYVAKPALIAQYTSQLFL
jgi:hypothetical protein